jgi:hypothetical protein
LTLLPWQRTPLALCAFYNWLDGVKAILALKDERKVDVNAVDKNVSCILLFSSCIFADLADLIPELHCLAQRFLLEPPRHSAFFDRCWCQYQYTAFHGPPLLLFLAFRCFFSKHPAQGYTPLISAASSGHVAGVTVLLEAGADLSLKTRGV